MEENFDREASERKNVTFNREDSEKNLEALDENLKNVTSVFKIAEEELENVTSVFKIAEEKLRKARETTRTEEKTME